MERIKSLQAEFQKSEQKTSGRSAESLSIMHTLGMAYWEAKLYEESKVVLQEAYEQRKALLGDAHVDTLTSMKCLATLQHKLGERKEAWFKLEVCHSKCKSELGEDHPLTAEVGLMLSTFSGSSSQKAKVSDEDKEITKPMSKKMLIKLILLGIMLMIIGYMIALRLSKSFEKSK
eukprot:gene30312-36626_t